ncbi:MAG: (2Fe-2S)-binding domain protein [Gammaproteobacteria bacterium]|nr:(2Fe-2S)-binding domain protein [Gammaproteobacteria bacterium]
MARSIALNVNGQKAQITVDDLDMPLLYALRNDLGLRGPRFGCGLGQCGACTVHIDGNAVRSCITPLSSVGSRDEVTL